MTYLEKIKQGESIVSTLQREKFSSQASPDVLAALRELAATQGRQFQAVLDDAMRDYLERQFKSRPRQHVMATFASSLRMRSIVFQPAITLSNRWFHCPNAVCRKFYHSQHIPTVPGKLLGLHGPAVVSN